MRNRIIHTLCTLAVCSCLAVFHADAGEVIVTDIVSDPSWAAQNELNEISESLDAETESEEISLIETEMTYEIPLGISDGLQKDTPIGEAAKKTAVQCEEFIQEMCEANSTEKFRENHEDVTATYSRYDEETDTWKDFNCTYTDHVIYYTDDWTPGLEELRTLIYGENDCVARYMGSMGYIRYLNASDLPYRSLQSTPVILADDTKNEKLLSVHRTENALYVITQMTETGILNFGLPEVSEETKEENSSAETTNAEASGTENPNTQKSSAKDAAPAEPASTGAIPADAIPADSTDATGSSELAPLFYSCLYVLDPDSLEVQVIRITAHYKGGSAVDVRNVNYSYDHGMSEFVKSGYIELMRHMVPSIAWGTDYIRTVKVTLDPGTKTERTYLAQPLMGDALAITLPDGYVLYSDEALSVRWIDDGNYFSDLTLWAARG